MDTTRTIRCRRCQDTGLIVTEHADPEHGPAFSRYDERPCTCPLGAEVERELEKLAAEPASCRIVDYDPEPVAGEDGKPPCQLTGDDGNAFAVIGRVSKALTNAGLPDRAAEFRARAVAARSYDDLLGLTFEYVDVH